MTRHHQTTVRSRASNSDDDGSAAADSHTDDDKKGKKKTRIAQSTKIVDHRYTQTVEYVAGEGVLGMQTCSKEL